MGIGALRAEMLDWAAGRKSHINEFMSVENGPECRQQTLVAVAQADAAEVQKFAAALSALEAPLLGECRALAADLVSYNPSHGDFPTAGKRLLEVLNGGTDA